MLIPKFVANFFILIRSSSSLHLIAVSSIALRLRKFTVCFFYACCFVFFPVYTYSRERNFSFSLSLSFRLLGPPPFNLIPRLSDRAHEKRIVPPTLSSSCQSRLPVSLFQPLHATLQVTLVLLSTLPAELQKTTWHLPLVPRSSSTLAACRFFTLYSVPLLRKLFFPTFSRLISLVTRQVTFFTIRTTTHGSSVLSIANFIFGSSIRRPFFRCKTLNSWSCIFSHVHDRRETERYLAADPLCSMRDNFRG